MSLKKINWCKLLLTLSILLLLSKILESYLFPVATLFGKIFFYSLIVLLVFTLIKNVSTEQLKRKSLIVTMLFCILSLCFVKNVSFRQIELFRYYFFKDYYNEVIREIVDNAEDTNGGYLENTYKTNSNFSILLGKKVFYQKSGDELMVNFVLSESFFSRHDFIYISSKEAASLFLKSDMYDQFEWIRPNNWAYIKCY